MYWFSCNKVISGIVLSLLTALLVPVVVSANNPTVADDISAGNAIYSQTCVVCHGKNGKGALPGVSDLTKVDGPLSKADEELIRSITDGVSSPGAALSMPAKGGNPALTEEDIRSVLVYLRQTYGS